MTTSSDLLDSLVDGGLLKESTASGIARVRMDLFEKVACDLVRLGFAYALLEASDDIEKTAAKGDFVDLLKNMNILGRSRINPDFQKVDPNVYDALQRAFQAGQEGARSKFPLSAMSLGNPWRTAVGIIALGMGSRLAGEGVAGVKGHLHRKKIGRDIALSREEMFEKFPELSENRGVSEETFDLLSRYSPSMAANPIVAGTFVQTSVGRGGDDAPPYIGPAEVKMLLDNQFTAEKIRDLADPGAKRIGEGVKKDVGDVLVNMMAGQIL
jgi:hypothetical protein